MSTVIARIYPNNVDTTAVNNEKKNVLYIISSGGAMLKEDFIALDKLTPTITKVRISGIMPKIIIYTR